MILTPAFFHFLGFGGLLSRDPPDLLPVLLGFPALPLLFDITLKFRLMPILYAFRLPQHQFPKLKVIDFNSIFECNSFAF